jgi:hypothetical protein
MVERPAPVLVSAIEHHFDGFTDAMVGLTPAFRR